MEMIAMWIFCRFMAFLEGTTFVQAQQEFQQMSAMERRDLLGQTTVVVLLTPLVLFLIIFAFAL